MNSLIRTPRAEAVVALSFVSLFFALPLQAQTDNPVLINITTLEQLDAVRYNLNGDGTPTGAADDITAYEAAFGLAVDAVISCTGGCTGYELMANLDFKNESADPNNYSIWAEGSTATDVVAEGWLPIGDNALIDPSDDPNDLTSPRYRYIAVFEGNNHTISNLYINRTTTSYIGLFGTLGSSGEVRHLGIEGGSVTGGTSYVGSLVGRNYGTISMCYATGNVTGIRSTGGLVGQNEGTISACYATGTATGTLSVGGLVGTQNSQGTISACYATGTATAYGGNAGGFMGDNYGSIIACYATGVVTATGTDRYAGGLVAENEGTIRACYATGAATATGTGSTTAGGLVGYSDGPINNSYFDYNVSNRPASDANSKTTAELQTPTVYDDDVTSDNGSSIYEAWNVDVDGVSGADDPWDFGTDMQYPALKVDFDGNGEATAYEFGIQGRSAPPLPNNGDLSLIDITNLEQLDAMRYDLDGNE